MRNVGAVIRTGVMMILILINFHLNKPFRLHRTKISSYIGREITGGIQHVWLAIYFFEHNPVPKILPIFLVILNREQCCFWQGRPLLKGNFFFRGFNIESRKHSPNVISVWAQCFIWSVDPHIVSNPFHFRIRFSNDVGHRCNAAPRRLFLHYWIHLWPRIHG